MARCGVRRNAQVIKPIPRNPGMAATAAQRARKMFRLAGAGVVEWTRPPSE